MEYRSPLDNVFNFISALPQGHDKPVKHALYNAIALFALVLCCAASYALYVILGPFIKPLMWALLVGSVLHPFKRSLSKKFKSWFDTMEETGTPIFIEIFVIPVNIINSLSDFVGDKLLQYIKCIVAVAIVIPFLHVIYYYTPKICITIIWCLATYTHYVITFVINYSTTTNIMFVLIGYITVMIFLWNPKNNMKFHIAAIIIWLLLSCFLVHQFGALQTPIFIIVQVIFLAGFIYEIYEIQLQLIAEGHSVSLVDAVSIAFIPEQKSKLVESETDKTHQAVKEEKQTSLVDTEKEATERPLNETEIKDKILLSTFKAKDPWCLELFENKIASLEDKVKKPSSVETDVKSTVSMQSTPTLLKGDSLESAPRSTVHDKKPRGVNKLKFQRSQSQPFASNWQLHSCLFNFKSPDIDALRSGNKKRSEYASDFYLYTLIWCCLVMLFWKNLMMLPFLIIPISIYILKHVGRYLGLWSWLYGYWTKIVEYCAVWCLERYDALVPIPVRGLQKFLNKLNSAVKKNLRNSIDTVASCVVILGLLIFAACASVFIAIQIYAEAIMLVQMTANWVNQIIVHNPELRQMLPPSFDDTVDSILDNAYQYGREGISKVVRSMVNNVDDAKSAKLEKQVLELWDRLYQNWMSSDNVHGPQVTTAAIQYSWNAFIDDIQKSPEMFNIQGITEFVKQNIGTFMSLLESIWGILKGNISLVLGSFSAFMSVLLGGGTAVLNFVLNVIVFLTTLFYLLSSSGDLYKPIELMTNFSTSGSRFGLALEGAVNGVFTATFKMAAFYGLWTWFIHNCFNVKIVYLPSALATILGAVPFLGTYWACLPAVLDLWLAQEKSFQAILCAFFQVLPMSIVDATIYNEIQGGGHPYLTGLAIAGGIFCLGVEGAIIGPLLLCGLYVAMALSSTLFRESPTEESLNVPNLSR
ncbi:hypothetical protein RI129_002590 [Pyrocoelia pectoralis]|uniref:Transmembrane protein 245 n=1 Tax=Pyrocoelia pectoralis TaxID=417401 RepID=A0AAN7VN71_9COLE